MINNLILNCTGTQLETEVTKMEDSCMLNCASACYLHTLSYSKTSPGDPQLGNDTPPWYTTIKTVTETLEKGIQASKNSLITAQHSSNLLDFSLLVRISLSLLTHGSSMVHFINHLVEN